MFNKDWLKERFATCIDGVSSAYAPELLSETALAWGRNITVRGGRAHTRPGIPEIGYLPSGRFQGIGYLSQDGGVLVAAVSGRLYRINFTSDSSFAINAIPLDIQNSPDVRRYYFCETPSALIIQDDQSDAIFYDGATARRSIKDDDEVPIGSHMAFANGRLWMAIEGGKKVIAGDILDLPGSELKFTEIKFLLGGGSYGFPNGVTGMAFMPKIDTQTGYGPLLVFSRPSTSSLHAEITARDTWQSTVGFESQVFPAIGAVGSITAVNQDLYWRTAGGEIRSFRQAVADLAGPGNAPISNEVRRVIDHDDPRLLEYGSSVYFDNRLLVTAAPSFDGFGNVIFNRLVSLDFATIGTMRGKTLPAFDGEWTGLNIRQVISGTFNGKDRAFVVKCDSSGRNILAEITKSRITESRLSSVRGGAVTTEDKVNSSIETRSFAFGDAERIKRLERLDVFLSDIRGLVWVWIYFRKDNESAWQKWDDFGVSAKTTDDSTTVPHVWKRKAPGYKSQVKTLTIPDVMTDDEHPAHVGYLFQVKIEWQGYCQLDRLRLFAKPLDEKPYADRDESTPLDNGGGTYIDQEHNRYVDQSETRYAVKIS